MPSFAGRAACVLALSTLPSSPHIQAQDTALVRSLSAHAVPLTLAVGRISGPGADLLRSEAGRSQFVLVGEDHGMRELPRLTAALFRAIQPAGYSHLAVEVGPYSGRTLEATLRRPGGRSAFARAVKANPWAVPFYAWVEEADMAADVVAATPGRTGTIWGLDQEFIGSPAVHLRRLARLAPNAAARTLALAYAAQAERADARVIAEKNPTLFFMPSWPAEMLPRLTSAFHPAAGSEAAGLIYELGVSAQIYAGQFDGHGYESNDERAGLMKRHFMELYRAARASGEAQPRVLVKLGAYHAIRGRSFTGVFDVGNMLAELVAANGSRSFHLFVLTARGTRNAYLPFVAEDREKAHRLDVAQDLDFMDAKPLLAAADPNAWTLIDVRPLRGDVQRGRFASLNPGLRTLLFGYDAVLVVPEAHADTLWIDMPQP
jgi:hypothetical protein